jgi:hypothetical protein
MKEKDKDFKKIFYFLVTKLNLIMYDNSRLLAQDIEEECDMMLDIYLWAIGTELPAAK